MWRHLLLRRCTDVLRQHLREVNGVAASVLRDLLAATEAVGDDNGVRIGRPHRREQDTLAKCLRDLVFSRSNPKGPAMPQQPESSIVTCAPVCLSNVCSAFMLKMAL